MAKRQPYAHDIIPFVLEMQSSVKAMHWLTKSNVQHKALDKLFKSVNEHGDLLVESLLALDAAPRKAMSPFSITIALAGTTPASIRKIHDHLVTKIRTALPDDQTKGVLDDIIIAFRKCMYLCEMS